MNYNLKIKKFITVQIEAENEEDAVVKSQTLDLSPYTAEYYEIEEIKDAEQSKPSRSY